MQGAAEFRRPRFFEPAPFDKLRAGFRYAPEFIRGYSG